MVESARRNFDLLAEIAGKSRDQALSIAEVTAAVRTMDEMTQHNAALVEETNASIEQTEAQANELDKVVAVFTVTDRHSSRPLEARPAVAGPNPVQRAYRSQGNAAISTDWNEL